MTFPYEKVRCLDRQIESGRETTLDNSAINKPQLRSGCARINKQRQWFRNEGTNRVDINAYVRLRSEKTKY